MNKNTKMILGVGAVAIVGYLVYKQMSKPKAGFANFGSISLSPSANKCCGHKDKRANAGSPSGYTFTCCNGQDAPYSNGNDCAKCPGGTKSSTTLTTTGSGF